MSAAEYNRDAALRAVCFAKINDEREEKAWTAWLAREDDGNTESFERAKCPALEIPPERFSEMLWHNDCGRFEGPEIAAEVSAADRAFAFSAHGEYLALCNEETGDTLPDEVLRKRSKQAAELLSMTVQLADKMADSGFNCYRETAFLLRRYYVHSRHIENLPSFRRCCFLPYVAQQIRRPMLAALEFWISKQTFGPRFWTLSSGARVVLADVRNRVKDLHGRISDLNAQPFMRLYGVRIAFRSTELGTPERRPDGQIDFNVHAHVVVEQDGFIKPDRWEKLLTAVRKHWGTWWKESERIRTAREVCKYVTKPGELLKLSGEELVSLHEQLYRLKLVQPMGTLADEIAERKENRQRLVKRKTPDGRVYFVEKDWNSHARKTRLEKNAEAAAKLAPSAARGSVRVVSRGAPGFGPSGVSEPIVTVMFMRGSWCEATVRGHALVAPLINVTAAKYNAGVARRRLESGLIVHTRTPTVLTDWAERPAKPRGKPKRAPMGAARAGF